MANAISTVRPPSGIREVRHDSAPRSLRILRPVVALGAHGSEAKDMLRLTAAEMGAPLVFSENEIPVTGAEAPLAFIVPLGCGLQDACIRIRLRRNLAHVPILAVANDEATDLGFSEVFSLGGDDVVPVREPERLKTRIRALGRSAAEAPLLPGRKGVAVVAGLDAAWRAVIGRVLANGGYDVCFAADAQAASGVPSAKLVVCDASIARQGGRRAMSDRLGGPLCPWVVLAAPKVVSAISEELKGLGRVVVSDAFAPPENVLFLANELGYEVASRRASPRLLYGTSVTFRSAGRDRDEVGFSYNLSAKGIYVRTLAPLDPGQEAWLELWPPRSDRRVRLVGKVVWRRVYGQSETATVPPGFGVQLTGGLGDDLDRYVAAYGLLGKANE